MGHGLVKRVRVVGKYIKAVPLFSLIFLSFPLSKLPFLSLRPPFSPMNVLRFLNSGPSGEGVAADMIPAQWPVGHHGCADAPDVFLFFLCFPVLNLALFLFFNSKFPIDNLNSLDLTKSRKNNLPFLQVPFRPGLDCGSVLAP